MSSKRELFYNILFFVVLAALMFLMIFLSGSLISFIAFDRMESKQQETIEPETLVLKNEETITEVSIVDEDTGTEYYQCKGKLKQKKEGARIVYYVQQKKEGD